MPLISAESVLFCFPSNKARVMVCREGVVLDVRCKIVLACNRAKRRFVAIKKSHDCWSSAAFNWMWNASMTPKNSNSGLLTLIQKRWMTTSTCPDEKCVTGTSPPSNGQERMNVAKTMNSSKTEDVVPDAFPWIVATGKNLLHLPLFDCSSCWTEWDAYSISLGAINPYFLLCVVLERLCICFYSICILRCTSFGLWKDLFCYLPTLHLLILAKSCIGCEYSQAICLA